jgi:Leucine-rich repeat (LRR) protein
MTQPLLFADEHVFVEALRAVPAEDWWTTWPTCRTIMLRRTSKKVKEQVRKMRLSTVVRLRGDGAHNDMITDCMCDLLFPMTSWYSISTLELSSCKVRGEFALYFLARVLLGCPALTHLHLEQNKMDDICRGLGHCTALAHLDLSKNSINAAGAEILPGVLVRCRALTHLNLCTNNIGPDEAASLAGVLGQCVALAHLNIGYNQIGNAGTERIAGVLGQCTVLTHLDLSGNDITDTGTESLAGVLAQCTALTHLNLG